MNDIKISACIIAKNEEHILYESLLSMANLVDEIIFVDTGSTDKTIEIASLFTSKIHHFTWIDDFSAARNYAHSLSQYNYILTWDADWVFYKGRQDFIDIKKKLNTYDCVHATWYMEFVNNEPNSPTTRPILYNKNKFKWTRPVHNLLQAITSNANSITLPNIEIIHKKDSVLKADRYKQTLAMVQQYLSLNPTAWDMQIMYAQELAHQNRHEEAIVPLQKILHNCNQFDIWISALELNCLYLLNLNRYTESVNTLNFFTHKAKNNLKFILLKADLLFFTDPISSLKFYKKFVQKADANFIKTNKARYIIHPSKMIAEITSLYNI